MTYECIISKPFLRNTNLNYAKIRPNLAFNFTISCMFAKFPESNLNAISSQLGSRSTQSAISSQFSFLFSSCLRRSSSQFGHGTKKNRGGAGEKKNCSKAGIVEIRDRNMGLESPRCKKKIQKSTPENGKTGERFLSVIS